MTDSIAAKSGRAARRGVLAALAVATLLGTGGCSSVPDAVNPVEWYRGTRDWIVGDDTIQPTDQTAAKPIPGADKPFPSLNSVPERPAATPESETRRMARTLAADREAARYTDEQIRRQAVDVTASPSGAPPPAPDAPETPAAAQAPPAPTAQQLPPPAPDIPETPPSVQVQPAPPAQQQPPAASSSREQPQAAAPAPARSSAPARPSPVPHQPVPVDIPSIEPSAGQAASLPQNPSRAMPPPPPPPVPPAVAAGQPVPVNSAPPQQTYSTPAAPPEQAGNAAASPRTAFARPDRFSNRFPSGAGASRAPRTLDPPPSSMPGTPGDGFVTSGPPVATIYFDVGSSKVGSRGMRAIREAFRAWQAKGGRIRVVGHASSRTRNLDRVSHELANFRVSDERARAVARELIRLGVDPTAIVVEAMSDHQPAYLEVMPAGEAGNRRAEILLEN